MPLQRSFLAGLAGVALFTSHIARAGTPDAPQEQARAEARTLASQGDEAFSRGRCDVAVPLWKQAESRFHAPTLLFRVARCQTILGKVVEAAATLQAIVDEKLGPNAPPPFLDAQRDAAGELGSVKARIASLEVIVDLRGIGATPIITVDDDPAKAKGSALDATFAVDPGAHRVRVAANDAIWEQTIQMKDGESRVVRVALGAEQKKSAIPPQRLVGYILGGVGIATMAVGGYFGATAVSDQHSLRDACPLGPKNCPVSAGPQIDSLRTKALVADLTIGGGAAVFVAAAILVLTAPPPKKEEPRVYITPVGFRGGAGASIGGRF